MTTDFSVSGLDIKLPVAEVAMDPEETFVRRSHYFMGAIEVSEITFSYAPDQSLVDVLFGDVNDVFWLLPIQRKAARMLLGSELFKAFLNGEYLKFEPADLEYMKRVIEADIDEV